MITELPIYPSSLEMLDPGSPTEPDGCVPFPCNRTGYSFEKAPCPRAHFDYHNQSFPRNLGIFALLVRIASMIKLMLKLFNGDYYEHKTD